MTPIPIRLPQPEPCMVCGTALGDRVIVDIVDGHWWACADPDACRARAGDLVPL